MATAAQLAANRKNAQRSTGPKSPEGKGRSRQNSLKHGLSGDGIVQPESESEKLEAARQSWSATLQPQNDVEAALITTAATAAVRLQRAADLEAAELDRTIRHLPLDLPTQKLAARDAFLATFATDPATTLRHLNNTLAGLDWLIAQWTTLKARLEAPDGHWTTPNLLHAAHLLGHTTWQGPTLRHLTRAALATQRPGHVARDLAWHLIGAKSPSNDEKVWAASLDLPDPPAARAELTAFVDAQLATLTDRRALVEPIESADDAEAPARALSLDTPFARRLLRYETALARQLNQSLMRLEHLRTGKLVPQNEPEAPPAPTTASSPDAPGGSSTRAPDHQNEPNSEPAARAENGDHGREPVVQTGPPGPPASGVSPIPSPLSSFSPATGHRPPATPSPVAA